MPKQGNPKFTFRSMAEDKDTFHVVKFKGTEGLSTIYKFDITLISKKADVNLREILKKPAQFIIKRDDGDIPFHGILSAFEQQHQAGGMVFYRAKLVPKLWWTTQTHHNQIFLDKNAQGFLGNVLDDGGLKQALNYEFELHGSYPSREYICQYDESHFNFVSRWMERDGMYYYFEQTDECEKMVITDTLIAHSPMPEGTSLTYSPPTNLDHAEREEVVKNFMLKQQPLPKKVVLKDYNYRKPSMEMKAEAVVSKDGLGEIYIYGEHFQTPGDGEKLAKIRAEEFLCREQLFHGVSSVPYVRTGYVFQLKDHYRDDFNQRYLTTEVTHEGSQEGYLTSGLGLNLEKNGDRVYYRNSFSCIPATTQFRAQRTSEKPKFAGSMNAKIDAAGSGQYAELDSHGRYKVILPLDVSGRSSGKATTWLRMAQPYGGQDHGMHFPLHKNTEVLLTCIDGDPDRPIIQAAVPNPEMPSQVTDANETQCKITTGGQNKIHMEDATGGERILMQTPKSNTWVRMGTPNDPPVGADDGNVNKGGLDGYKLNTTGAMEAFVGTQSTTVLGNSLSMYGGLVETIIVGNEFKTNALLKQDVILGLDMALKIGGSADFSPLHKQLRGGTLKLQGDVTKLTGDVKKVRGDVTKVRGDVNSLDGDVNTLRGDQTDLKGDHDQLKGACAKLATQTSDLSGAVEFLAADVSELAGETTCLTGAVTELSGGKDTAVGEFTEAIGESTRAIGDSTTVAGATTKITAETNTIAGLINQI